MPSLDQILAVILGGGVGQRLHPLTQQRSKPAVPIAGKYRLIDIPISNCINSGIYRVAILTQFNSVSLHRHISQTYNFDVFHTGWVDILAAEQTPERADWYQGTADAVRKQLFEIRATGAEYVLILAGDHLYRMDFADLEAKALELARGVRRGVEEVRRAGDRIVEAQQQMKQCAFSRARRAGQRDALTRCDREFDPSEYGNVQPALHLTQQAADLGQFGAFCRVVITQPSH